MGTTKDKAKPVWGARRRHWGTLNRGWKAAASEVLLKCRREVGGWQAGKSLPSAQGPWSEPAAKAQASSLLALPLTTTESYDRVGPGRQGKTHRGALCRFSLPRIIAAPTVPREHLPGWSQAPPTHMALIRPDLHVGLMRRQGTAGAGLRSWHNPFLPTCPHHPHPQARGSPQGPGTGPTLENIMVNRPQPQRHERALPEMNKHLNEKGGFRQ